MPSVTSNPVRRDVDALIMYALAIAVVLLFLFAPDALIERARKRWGSLVTVVALPTLVTKGGRGSQHPLLPTSSRGGSHGAAAPRG